MLPDQSLALPQPPFDGDALGHVEFGHHAADDGARRVADRRGVVEELAPFRPVERLDLDQFARTVSPCRIARVMPQSSARRRSPVSGQ